MWVVGIWRCFLGFSDPPAIGGVRSCSHRKSLLVPATDPLQQFCLRPESRGSAGRSFQCTLCSPASIRICARNSADPIPTPLIVPRLKSNPAIDRKARVVPHLRRLSCGHRETIAADRERLAPLSSMRRPAFSASVLSQRVGTKSFRRSSMATACRALRTKSLNDVS